MILKNNVLIGLLRVYTQELQMSTDGIIHDGC